MMISKHSNLSSFQIEMKQYHVSVKSLGVGPFYSAHRAIRKKDKKDFCLKITNEPIPEAERSKY
jgi:hypothetical protein